jgi:fucose permease
MIAPTIATALITKANRQWYEFYYVLAGMAFLELVSLTMAFWNATADEYRASHPTTQFIATSEAHEQAQRWLNRAVKRVFGNSRTAEALKSRVTWVCSIFLTAYVGVEVAIGGWVVVFMLRVRGGGPFPSGMTSTGFWAGLTIGRVILGFVTPRLFKSEKHAIIVYLGISLAFELLFWLIPNFYVSAVMVSFLGFFLGPLFPAAIVAATKLLPKQLHVPAIGFAAAVGASGATVLPFAVGAIANSRGVWVLQPFILAILVACLGIWLCLPSLTKKVQ